LAISSPPPLYYFDGKIYADYYKTGERRADQIKKTEERRGDKAHDRKYRRDGRNYKKLEIFRVMLQYFYIQAFMLDMPFVFHERERYSGQQHCGGGQRDLEKCFITGAQKRRLGEVQQKAARRGKKREPKKFTLV